MHIYVYQLAIYKVPVFFRKFSFLLFVFFLHSVTLSRSCNPKRVNLVKQKAQERDSPNQVSDRLLFKHVPLQTKGKKKRYFLFAVVVGSLILSHLFRCQFRGVDSKSGRKSKAASSLCFETTRPHGSRRRNMWTCALGRPAYKAGPGARKGKRGGKECFYSPAIHSEQLFQTLAFILSASTHLNCLVQLFLLLSLFFLL